MSIALTLYPTEIQLFLLPLLDRFYKMAMEDAYAHSDDDGAIREFISQMSLPGRFGLMRDGYMLDWIDWQLKISSIAKQFNRRKMAKDYARRMGDLVYGQNFLSVLYPLSMRIVIKAMEDYLVYGSRYDMERLKEKRYVRLDKDGLKVQKTDDLIAEIQIICGELKRRDAEYRKNWVDPRNSKYEKLAFDEPIKYCLDARQYDEFRRRIANLPLAIEAKKVHKERKDKYWDY